MPYKVEKQGSKFAVVGPDGKVMGAHDTEESAMRQMKALMAKMMKESQSTDDKLNIIRAAFVAKFNPPSPSVNKSYCYVEDIFLEDGYLVCQDEGILYRVDFSRKDGQYQFSEKNAWKKVEQTYVAAESHKPPVIRGTKEAPRASVLRESMAFTEAQADDEHLAIRGVTLIRAGFSSNADKSGHRRYYPPAVLRASVPAFEGAVVHVNHPGRKDGDNLPEGDALGVRGWYENVRWDESTQALKGDQILVDRKSTREELYPILKAAIASKPDLVELSINAVGQTRLGEAEGQKAVIIESIEKGRKPNRVDIVTAGAAGGSYQGALLASDDDDLTARLLAAVSFEQWRESHPEYLDKLKVEWKTTRDSKALTESQSELSTLKSENSRLSEELRAAQADLGKFHRAAQADSVLKDSGLPVRIREAVRAELLEQADEDAMRKVVAREAEKYRLSPRPEPAPVSESATRSSDRPAHTSPTITHPLLESFGVASRADAPRDNESPEAWYRRTHPN